MSDVPPLASAPWIESPAAALPARRRGLVRYVILALWTLILTVLALYAIAYLDFARALIAYPFDIDQGEGYDVNSGWLLTQGRWIYNNNDVFPFYSSNYPPVYSLVLAGLLQIFGLSLGTGRLLSTAAALATALLIVSIVRRQKGPWPVAIAAGLLYLASPYVYHTTPLARVNALMVLFATAAVYALGQVTVRWTLAGVGLAVLALYTKQTAIDAVAAGLIYLIGRNWRLGLAAVAAVAAIGGLLFLGLEAASGGYFSVNIVAGNINAFHWEQAARYLADYLDIHLVLVSAAGCSVAWALWHRRINVFHVYFLISLPFTLTAGKWGAGESYFLGNIVASCLCLAWLATHLWHRRSGLVSKLVIPAVLIWQLIFFTHGPFNDLLPGWRDRSVQSDVLGRPPSAADLEAGQRLTAYFGRYGGLVLAEENGFVLATGGTVIGNASHLRNLYRSGDWNPANLIREIEARRFGTVVLSGHHYPEPVMQALSRHYKSAERFQILTFGYLVLIRSDEPASR